MLADQPVAKLLVDAWQAAGDIHQWCVGRYVVMPDHVHFFAGPRHDEASELSRFIGSWKRWAQRRIRQSCLATFAWQLEFFDHLLRKSESYSEKWDYVRLNPERARLVDSAE